MGLYVKGANGAFYGKVGSVVGSNWRSINYLRSLPKPSSKKATEKQIAHRAKFAMVLRFLAPMRQLINIGQGDKSRQKSTGFNQVTNEVMALVQGQYPDFTIPYKDVVFASGLMSNVKPKIGKTMDGDWEMTWVHDENLQGTLPDDILSIILYDASRNDYYVFQGGLREAQSYTFNSAALGSGEFHIWYMFTSADGLSSTSSNYYGTILLEEEP